MTSEPLIRVTGLRKTFGNHRVLDGLDLDVRAREAVAVLGANGAGKTTLLKVLATLVRPTRGTVTVAGHDCAKDPELVRREIGLVAHSSYVYEDLTAAENLTFWATLAGLRPTAAERAGALATVELERAAAARVRTFSAGMKRRLSLARFVLARPRVLLLDEPFTGLDQRAKKWLEEHLASFKAGGGAIVMTTHSFGRELAVARRRPDRDPGRRRHRVRHSARLPVRRRRAPALRPARGGRVLTFARRALVVVWKDLLVERRSKETLNALFFFGLLLLFVFQFALGPDRERLAGTLPGLLWLGFILSGLLGLCRTFLVERENDCWEGLLLAPGDKSAIYVGKLVGNLLLMLVIETILLVLFGFFFNLDLASALPGLAVVIALGTVAFAAVGTLFAAMTAQVRARELLFPVLLLPVEAPVLLATVKATEAVLLGETLGSVAHWLKLLAAADVVYVAVGVLTFDFVMEG